MVITPVWNNIEFLFLDLNVASPSSPNMSDHYSAGKSTSYAWKHGKCTKQHKTEQWEGSKPPRTDWGISWQEIVLVYLLLIVNELWSMLTFFHTILEWTLNFVCGMHLSQRDKICLVFRIVEFSYTYFVMPLTSFDNCPLFVRAHKCIHTPCLLWSMMILGNIKWKKAGFVVSDREIHVGLRIFLSIKWTFSLA